MPLVADFAKRAYPYKVPLMLFCDGARINFSHGKTNNLTIATCRWKNIIKHMWLGSIWRHCRKKRFRIIQKALGLSLVSDAFSHKLKTFVLLRKKGGGNQSEIHVSRNGEIPLGNHYFWKRKSALRKPYKHYWLWRLLNTFYKNVQMVSKSIIFIITY